MKTFVMLYFGLLLVGCSTTKRQEVILKTLQAVSITVDHAMMAYADMRVAGKIDDITHAKVVPIKLKYEKAMAAAVAAAQGDLSKWAPEDVIAVSNELVSLILDLTKKS